MRIWLKMITPHVWYIVFFFFFIFGTLKMIINNIRLFIMWRTLQLQIKADVIFSWPCSCLFCNLNGACQTPVNMFIKDLTLTSVFIYIFWHLQCPFHKYVNLNANKVTMYSIVWTIQCIGSIIIMNRMWHSRNRASKGILYTMTIKKYNIFQCH